MGQRFFWLWLLLWSLLCLHAQEFPVRRAKRTHDNTEHVHVSLLPIETVHLAPDRKEELGKKEENIVNKLVVLLKDTVEKIPTQRPSEKPPIITFQLEASPSVIVDTLWVNHKPKNGEVQTQAASSADEIAKTTTPFWRLRNDSVATIVLHTETTASTKTTPERLQSESSASVVVHSDHTISETPTATVSLLLEKVITTGGKSKTFDQLTKGTLSELVASLKKIDKVHDMLHKATDKPQQEGNHEKHKEGHRQPEAAHNLELINTMMKTIRNSPLSVKNDPALHNNVEKAERLLQADLKLVGEAEKRLKEAKDREEKERQISLAPLPNLARSDRTILLAPVSPDQEQEKKRKQQISPSPPPPHLTVSDATILLVPVSSDQEQEKKREQHISPSPPHLTVSDVTVQLTTVSSDSLAKAEETQVKNGEFKSLIKLLYDFNGHAENPPNKKVERDIINKTIAALDAIKTISSGKDDKKSKKMLQQWFKKDMALEKQTIWKS